MQEKIIKKEIVKEIKVYITDDGTEFDKEDKCKLHEFMVYLKNLKEYSVNVKQLNEIEGIPYPGRFTSSEEEDYWYHSLGREFCYMIPLNAAGIKELNDLIKLHPGSKKHQQDIILEENIGKIHCLEFFGDSDVSPYFECLEDIILCDIREFYNKIEYEVIARPKAQNEPLNIERIEQIIYEFVASGYGDNEAYAPSYDLREMACEIANWYNDKNYNPDFTPRYEWDEEEEE